METAAHDLGRFRRPRPITWLRENARAADLILAVVTTTISIFFHLADFELDDQEFTDPAWWTVILVFASVFPIYWRRTRPIPSTLFVVAAQVVAAFADIDGTGFIGVLIALYSIGAHASGRRRTQTLIAVTLAVGTLFIAGLSVSELDVGSFVSSIIILVTGFVLGDNLRRRREAAQALSDRLERAERERELLAHQHVTAERARIARELHDVVAHSVSVMVIQAAAARRNLTSSPATAEEALANIEQTGRQTMTELRGVLGVLRKAADPAGDATGDAGAGQTPQLDPQPTLSSVRQLVESSSDLPITLTTTGDLDDLASSVDLTGYRIVQEAITNVRRHAGPVTTVEIDIERHDDSVELTVADDGRGAAADDSGSGYGIVGMRERVAAVGGDITANSRSGGGWQVRASLPISAAAPTRPTSQQPVSAGAEVPQ